MKNLNIEKIVKVLFVGFIAVCGVTAIVQQVMTGAEFTL